MKVLHVIPAVAARYGGPSVATAGICQALGQLGAATLVATTDADGAGRLRLPIGREVCWEGVPAIIFPRVRSESFKWSPGLAQWLKSHVTDFDVVHIHAVLSHACLAAARACRASGVPYLVRPLGTLDPWSLSQHALRKRLLMMFGAGAALRGASGMHYTSREEQRLAEVGVPGLPAGYVVPLGVSDDLFTAGSGHLGSDPSGSDPKWSDPKVPEPYVLALSRIDPKKGIDVLLRAWHRLAADGALGAWSLRIAGDGDDRYMSEMRALAAKGPGSPRITFVGWVDGADRRALLRHAGLFALPSNQENFGFALAEALASGVPAIVSPGVNLSADIVAAGAGWVSTRADFAEVLGAALASPVTCRERGRQARVYAEHFRWPRVGARLLEIYGTIAAGNPHPRRVISNVAPPVDGVGVCS